jgi:hypothetical protein
MMKKKNISDRVRDRLKTVEKIPAHQQGRMRSALVPHPEKEADDDEEIKPEYDKPPQN